MGAESTQTLIQNPSSGTVRLDVCHALDGAASPVPVTLLPRRPPVGGCCAMGAESTQTLTQNPSSGTVRLDVCHALDGAASRMPVSLLPRRRL